MIEPRTRTPWVSDDNVALLTDLYQLTMVQAYWRERMFDDAVFSLFVRRLPRTRNFLVACGLDDALHCIEALHFDDRAIASLHEATALDPAFLDWLSRLRFTGEVRAVPEGTVLFANEPILEVRAPLPEAQLIETIVMNQVHLQTLVASKAARVVLAARGRTVVDFGLRRMHGADAGLKAARACYIAGVDATSNVLAGRAYGVPITGTMAHSYVQSHATELAAFREFAALYPETVLLVDTYDTLAGVRNVIELAREPGSTFGVRAIRLDSGDLRQLAVQSRTLLDEAGLHDVRIFATSGLDEFEIERLLDGGAPIDGFGVGGAMGISTDAPVLDIVYKLAEYAGIGRVKLSADKPVLPGAKQVFRSERDGSIVGDVIAAADETLDGRPLLQTVMANGERLASGRIDIDAARASAAAAIAQLPQPLRRITGTAPPYSVEVSQTLRKRQSDAARRAAEGSA